MPFVAAAFMSRTLDDVTREWLAALERRHMADLTLSEIARALRALSSCYVERRSKLPEGGALASAGKRAAFALFYGPMHFFVTGQIVRALAPAHRDLDAITDLGCGTGAAGTAWAVESSATRIRGFDRHPWAIDEANAAYRHFGLTGRAHRQDISNVKVADTFPRGARAGVIAAYSVNELTPGGRTALLTELARARAAGARILVIEPIARRALAWWEEWRTAFDRMGGRADEWRFPAALPATQRSLARAAGLDPRELTARSLFV
jgi:hypothetical protein